MLPAIRYGLPPALAVLAGLLLLLAAVERAEAQDLDDGVVKLVVTTHGGMGRTGSGFLVRLDADRAYIVTAAHVVEGAKETGVVFKAHRLDPPVAATVVGPEHWDRRGLALVVIPAAAARAAGASPLPLSAEGQPGTEIELRLIGHPRSVGDWSSLYGRVAARDGKMLKVQAPVNEGSSGGPVMRKGEVVGIVVEELAEIAIVAPAVSIRTYLDGQEVVPGLAAGAEKIVVAPLKPLRGKPVETFRDCPTCPEMVVIPAGSFQMGSPAREKGRADAEGPVHLVQIAQPFALGRREVTVGEFRAFVQATGHVSEAEKSQGCAAYNGGEWAYDAKRNWRALGFTQGEDHPVVCLSWNDAKAYLKWLSKESGQTYRLPSEAEWEYAARAGTTTARFWGESADQACAYANVADKSLKAKYPDSTLEIHGCDDRYVHTAPVGSFKPNAFGLLDILGNALEWTEDCWNDSYKGAPGDGSAWEKGDCARRVLRGGAWIYYPDLVRSAYRLRDGTGVRGNYAGFRPARTL